MRMRESPLLGRRSRGGKKKKTLHICGLRSSQREKSIIKNLYHGGSKVHQKKGEKKTGEARLVA